MSLVIALVASLPASAAPLQLLSARDASVTTSAGGNDNSFSPGLSSDGRFVVFCSSANNLVTGDNGQLRLDIFLRDRTSNTTVLVSANFSGTGGGNGDSMFGQVSTNGRYAVFQSEASDLLPGDTNGVSDIFVRDVSAASNILVSVSAGGGWANGASTDPVMTPDGRYVLFVSAATNLVAGDTNAIPDLFVRDLIARTTTLVSTGAFGAGASMAEAVITPDGHCVAFSSTAKGLASGVPATSRGEVYVRNLTANTTTWVSSDATTIVSNTFLLGYMPSYHPAISEDGNFVAFKTGWTNGAVPPPAPGVAVAMIFRYDFTAGSNSVVATNAFPRGTYSEDVYGPEMTPDGRFITFVATNKSPDFSTSVQLWDAQTATNMPVSVDLNGNPPTNSFSQTPMITPDGRFVAFLSNATNLTDNAVSTGFHIFLRDLQTGLTQLVDADTNGVGSIASEETVPGLSTDGRFVAFDSPFGGCPANVFVRDTLGGTNELISAHAPGLFSQTGGNLSWLSDYYLSDDGHRVVFTSYADDLVPNDTNRASDVFVSDLVAGTNALVSAGTDGNPALGGFSANPVISGNGRFVAFISTATNLVDGQTNLFNNLYLRDLQTGTNILISVSTNGISPGNGDSSDAVISQDGRYVAFLSKARNLATNLSGTGPNAFWRDVNSGVTVSLAGTMVSTLHPTMSADGRYVAYSRSTSELCVWDSQRRANIYTNANLYTLRSAAISPTGTQLVYQVSRTIYVYNLASRSIIYSIASTPLISSSKQWSADGRFLTFASDATSAFGDANGVNDIFMYDLSTSKLTLISFNNSQTGSGNGPSDAPAISGDGRFVVYRSSATDIVTGVTNPPPNIFLYDRLTGLNSLVTVASSSVTNWVSHASRPAINYDGRTVAFGSWAGGLVPNDLNRVQDVFAESLTPFVTTDSDGDDIPDWWMTQYFEHATGQAGDSSRAQDDADGDGLTNLQEYLTGTNPRDPASVFRLQIAPMVSPGSVTLTWASVPGGSYQIQYKTNLTDSAWLNLPGNPTVIGNQGYFIVPASQPNRFYRIVEGN